MPPGFEGLEAFDAARHRGVGICGGRAERFGGSLNACYLAATEFFRALRHFPIAFVRGAGPDEYFPVAVFGLENGRNLFVDDTGRWESGVYRPAYLRAYPFHTLELPPESEGADARALVCVDPAGLCPDEPPLLDAEGQSTSVWDDRQGFLRDYDNARRQTRQLIEAIAGLDLLEAFEAHAHTRGGRTLRLGGIHRVAEQRLNALAPDDLADLVRRGLLSRIYAHLISLDNFAALLERSAARE